jgi:hypothetical protein
MFVSYTSEGNPKLNVPEQFAVMDDAFRAAISFAISAEGL